MVTIWIGDFRSRQVQQHQEQAKDNSTDNFYLMEDTAEYSWFNTGLLEQLPHLAAAKDTVVIMLGFNDCVYSCVWEKIFNIKKIAANYVKTINDLIKDYSSIKFYVCSVNPVDLDYPFAACRPDGIVLRETLTAKIEQFNSIIKSSCQATYIDTYKYLTDTVFYTHDGVHFDTATIANLEAYISMAIGRGSSVLFKARDTEDKGPTGNIQVDGDFWFHEPHGGLNPYILPDSYKKHESDVLPNCTAWAYGRFYEILGAKPKLKLGNAEQWYDYKDDGYKRGETPALGAVICWQDGPTTNSETSEEDAAGHVAIVERINPDGSIITSESGWNTKKYWWLTRRYKDGYYDTEGNQHFTGKNSWGAWSEHGTKFQGFIYCPTTVAVTKDELWTENRGGASDEDMKPNAQYIWQYLGQRGWSINAVAALLGNLAWESGMSPCIWESGINGSIIGENGEHTLNGTALEKYRSDNGRYPGYGLVQWTPYTTLIDWCDKRNLPYWDIDSQLERIDWQSKPERTKNESGFFFPGYFSTDWTWDKYKDKPFDTITFEEFTVSTEDPAWLAAAFAICYEKPASIDSKDNANIDGDANEERRATCEQRGKLADKWYNYIKDLPLAISDTKLRVEELKVTKVSSTSVQLSFLTRNAKKIKYTLGSSSPVELDLDNVEDDLMRFTVRGLIPNEKYTLKLEATNKDPNKSKTDKSKSDSSVKVETIISKTIHFTTTQEPPESINRVKLSAKDSKLPNEEFKLVVTPDSSSLDWGYWKKNGYGYTFQLIVNGRVREEKEIDSLPSSFKLKDYFKHKIKVGDTVQIGIRTWVNYDHKRLYDNYFAKASNPICMLKKPVIAYLNKD